MALTITDTLFHRILTIVGYPVIGVGDLGISEDDIKDLLISPALEDYYRYFPIKVRAVTTISTDFSVAFPDDNTFGVLDVRHNKHPYSAGGARTAHTLINDLIITQGSSFSMKKWGTENSYDYHQVRIMDRLRRDAVTEKAKTFTVVVDHENRVVSGYVNTYGKLLIVWAKRSENFASVKFNQQEDAIKLAKSYVANYFGVLWSLDNSSLPNELDPSELLSQSESLKTEVMKKWTAHTKSILVRG